MYILIKMSLCPDLKKEISVLIDEDELPTWRFVKDDGKRRLMHVTKDNQFNDVVLRFITTYVDGISYIKILPTVATNASDTMKTKLHKGIVLGRFAELLNTHFNEIDQYKTILD